MSHKTVTKLALAKKPTPAEAQADLDRKAEGERWDKAEDSLRITCGEARRRVRVLREILEGFRDQLEGAAFDFSCCGDAPRSICHYEHTEIETLVDNLSPLGKGLFKMIDDFASEHGCDDLIDFNSKLFRLKMELAETGFQIGVLAGAILAGCSKERVDKFERGLAFSLASNALVVKD